MRCIDWPSRRVCHPRVSLFGSLKLDRWRHYTLKAMKTLLFILVVVVLGGCRTTPLSYSGGDGSSHEQAVIIRGARDTETGIDAENAWIRQRHAGAQKTMQALESVGRRHYDVIRLTLSDGQTKSVYFDITDFFGK